MPSFTTEDLLLFMYDEMEKREKAALERELQHNWALREKFQVLKEAEYHLNKCKLQGPRSQTIDAIMQYASNCHQVNSQSTSIEYIWLKGNEIC